MRKLVTVVSAVAGLLLATAGAASGPAAAAAPCSGQILTNPGFERGTTGWTSGPRIVVLGDQVRPAHTGRAYAALAGLDLSHSDVIRATVTVPANCTLTLGFWVRATTTETSRGDYLNAGLSVTGVPPKTIFSFAFDHPAQWTRHTTTWSAAATERTAIVSFAAAESAGGGVTAFDVDDVTITLG
ncbi:hypothetical protein Aab01nite_64380 [Paractinoplanes abujensis]|uniref:CBM-cenC domain-containing protein n=1 Tax=Paractinoplanes abujensis TaxID=882441 RepID=A0A7W7G3E7_9ACTN|nr:hypothetical protein [Actinoplanes abujensis]MBB4692651.1 hypothetical protein [Actinoplanes abujensis]GID22848.1 hypothetical protein Aab01nite_64380 [Actinoplanes abujensis]